MDTATEEKLKRFMKDKVLVEAVFGVFQKSFLKRREKDVQYLAAKTLALEFLEDAEKEFGKYDSRDNDEISEMTQNAL